MNPPQNVQKKNPKLRLFIPKKVTPNFSRPGPSIWKALEVTLGAIPGRLTSDRGFRSSFRKLERGPQWLDAYGKCPENG